MSRISVWLLFLVWNFIPLFAHANYDNECMRLLLNEPPLTHAMVKHSVAWIRPFQQYLGIDRDISALELEVIKDINHYMPVVVTFDNGKRQLLFGDEKTVNSLKTIFRRRTIVEAKHTDEATRILGEVLKVSCVTLSRPQCEVYEAYPGIGSSIPRPFSPREELIIKWSTLHGLPSKRVVKMTKTMSASDRQKIIDSHTIQLALKIEEANELVKASFSEEDANRLLKDYVEPYLVAGFDEVVGLIKGRSPVH